jgi:hypothetical protein
MAPSPNFSKDKKKSTNNKSTARSKKNIGGPRPGAGRKSLDDKKTYVRVWAYESTFDQLGGKKHCQDLCMEFLEQKHTSASSTKRNKM